MPRNEPPLQSRESWWCCFTNCGSGEVYEPLRNHPTAVNAVAWKKDSKLPNRRVQVTAANSRTLFRVMEERSILRLQHLLKRERPTGTEQTSLI
jgi:hypothetical protein